MLLFLAGFRAGTVTGYADRRWRAPRVATRALRGGPEPALDVVFDDLVEIFGDALAA